MRINTNVAAMSAHRNLSKTGVGLGKSIERLSSGLRINRAGDDAAGLVISQKLRAESSGLKQSVRNAQDGISFVQTAEGALDEVGGMLNRMRDLTVQYLNGTQDSDSQAAIQAEFDALGAEILRIGSSTEFAGKAVFNGTAAVDFQVGNKSGDQISVPLELLATASGATSPPTARLPSYAISRCRRPAELKTRTVSSQPSGTFRSPQRTCQLLNHASVTSTLLKR